MELTQKSTAPNDQLMGSGLRKGKQGKLGEENRKRFCRLYTPLARVEWIGFPLHSVGKQAWETSSFHRQEHI